MVPERQHERSSQVPAGQTPPEGRSVSPKGRRRSRSTEGAKETPKGPAKPPEGTKMPPAECVLRVITSICLLHTVLIYNGVLLYSS